MHKEDFKGFFSDTRHYKGKEILHGNFIGKDSVTLYNGQIEGEKNNNKKSNLKEVRLMEDCDPIIKEKFGQARGVLDHSDSDLAAKHFPITTERGSEVSINWPDLEDTRRDRSAVSLDVGNLDSGRHSAVVFHESTQTKKNNNAPPLNNFGFSPVISSGLGKVIKNR
ncbi:hypothetical protein Golob_025423, partial [Gossypium lobatum]|nr:hypothetical protein [Gossypium lobatum]